MYDNKRFSVSPAEVGQACSFSAAAEQVHMCTSTFLIFTLMVFVEARIPFYCQESDFLS